MLKILHLLGKVVDVITADGNERLKISIQNIFYIAFSVLCIWGSYKLFGLMTDAATSETGGCTCENAGLVFGYGFAILICIFTGLFAFITGVISQAVLLVFSFLGILISSTRGANAAAFFIALITLGGAIVGSLFIFGLI